MLKECADAHTLPVNERQTLPLAPLGDLELSTVEADA